MYSSWLGGRRQHAPLGGLNPSSVLSLVELGDLVSSYSDGGLSPRVDWFWLVFPFSIEGERELHPEEIQQNAHTGTYARTNSKVDQGAYTSICLIIIIIIPHFLFHSKSLSLLEMCCDMRSLSSLMLARTSTSRSSNPNLAKSLQKSFLGVGPCSQDQHDSN